SDLASAYTLDAWREDDRSDPMWVGEESPDSTERGARRKPGAVSVRAEVAWIGPQRRVWLARVRVKRGNPHLLQPQAWPLTLLAEARVEGTASLEAAGLRT